MNGWQRWGGRLQRAVNVRVGCSALLTGLLAAVVVGLKWPSAVTPVMFTVAAIFWLAVVFSDVQMTACDACGKRVKIGATTCSHCGYSRA